MPPKFSAVPKSLKVHPGLLPLIEQRYSDEHLNGFTAYTTSLMVFDLSTRYHHSLTAQIVNDPPYVLDNVVEEIVRDFPALPVESPWYLKHVRRRIEREIRKEVEAELREKIRAEVIAELSVKPQ